FTLSEDDYIKCLSDAEYRNIVVSRRDAEWSRNISDSHNRGLLVMFPKKGREKYVPVLRMTDLPLKEVVGFLGSKAEQHVGEMYVIAGTLLDETAGTNSDGTDKHVLVFYADTDNDRKQPVVLGNDALRIDQKIFISQHCWLNTAEY